MNACKNLDRFLESQLDSIERDEFESHLAFCDSCRSEVDADRELDARIRFGWSSIKAPNHLQQPVSQATRSAQVPGDRNNRLAIGTIGLVALIAAFIVFASWYFGERKDQEKHVSNNPIDVELADVGEGTLPAVENKEVTVVSNLSEDSKLILVTQPQSNEQFTIVNAYPTLSITKHSPFEFERKEDDQTN